MVVHPLLDFRSNLEDSKSGVIDVENSFLWLLMIGQKWQMELGSLFANELCVHSLMSMVVSAIPTSPGWLNVSVCSRLHQ